MSSTKTKDTIKDNTNPEAYAAEVLKYVKQLKDQKERLQNEMKLCDTDKKKLQQDIRYLTDKLAKVNYTQAQKTQLLMELEKTIVDIENAYTKLLESSQVLYKSVKETKNQILQAGNSSKIDFVLDKRSPATNSSYFRNDGVGPSVAATVAAEMKKGNPN